MINKSPVFANKFIQLFGKYITKDVEEKYLLLYNKYEKSKEEIRSIIEIKKCILNEEEISIDIFKKYNSILKTNSVKKHYELEDEIRNNPVYITVNTYIKKMLNKFLSELQHFNTLLADIIQNIEAMEVLCFEIEKDNKKIKDKKIIAENKIYLLDLKSNIQANKELIINIE